MYLTKQFSGHCHRFQWYEGRGKVIKVITILLLCRSEWVNLGGAGQGGEADPSLLGNLMRGLVTSPAPDCG